jgi:hypothetical protein
MVENEADTYTENVSLLSSIATSFHHLVDEYYHQIRLNNYKTLTMHQCLTVLKRISQTRLALGYLIESVSAHEETVQFNVILT